jgi:hypothetical protein
VERLILLGVAQGSVVFIIFTFNLVALFFFLPMIIVVVVVLRQLLSFVRVFSCRYHDHNLNGVLPPEERIEGSRATTLAEVVHLWVPNVRWADIQCSSRMYDEDKPSKIWKQERIR